MRIFRCYPRRRRLFVVSSFVMITALLAASFLLPLSARAATSFPSHPTSGVAVAALSASSSQPNFGPNVRIFNPNMPQSEIQATVDAVANEQVSNQFGTQRYALPSPAIMDPVPTPSTFRSATTPQCFGPGNCTALVNFWRSLSNLTINATELCAREVAQDEHRLAGLRGHDALHFS